MRRFIIATGAVVALAVGSVSPALALVKEQVYGCSDGFSHVEATFKMDKDRNGNGYVCRKLVLQPGKQGFYIVTDDHAVPVIIHEKPQ